MPGGPGQHNADGLLFVDFVPDFVRIGWAGHTRDFHLFNPGAFHDFLGQGLVGNFGIDGEVDFLAGKNLTDIPVGARGLPDGIIIIGQLFGRFLGLGLAVVAAGAQA